jgi:hypothetical protein
MARGPSTNYQTDLGTAAGTGPVPPTSPPNAITTTQYPTGTTDTSDLLKMMFPTGNSPLPTSPPDPTHNNLYLGNPAQVPFAQPNQTLPTPSSIRPMKPGSGGTPFNPFGMMNRINGV